MKRVLILAIVGVLLSIGLVFASGAKQTSGASSTGGTGVTTLKYWSLFTGPDGAVMKQIVDKYNSVQSKVKVDFSITKWSNYYDQLTAAIAGGNAPDIAISHTRYLPQFASPRFLHPIGSYIPSSGFSTSDFINPRAWERGTIGGHRYAVPLDIVISVVLYYNTDLFNKAGISGPPETAAQIVSDAKAIKSATGDWGLWIPPTGAALYRLWFSLLHQEGGHLLNANNTSAAFDSPAGVKALAFLVNAIKSGGAFAKNFGPTDPFSYANVGMDFNGDWMSRGFNQQTKLHYKLTKMPALFQSGNHDFFADSQMFIFPQHKGDNSARVRDAVDFAVWVSKNSIMWAKDGLPARASVDHSAAFSKIPNAEELLTSAKFATYPPAILKESQMETDIINGLEAAIAMKLSPSKALSQAASEVNAFLG